MRASDLAQTGTGQLELLVALVVSVRVPRERRTTSSGPLRLWTDDATGRLLADGAASLTQVSLLPPDVRPLGQPAAVLIEEPPRGLCVSCIGRPLLIDRRQRTKEEGGPLRAAEEDARRRPRPAPARSPSPVVIGVRAGVADYFLQGSEPGAPPALPVTAAGAASTRTNE